jgi:hypothetical protein
MEKPTGIIPSAQPPGGPVLENHDLLLLIMVILIEKIKIEVTFKK